MNDSKVAFSVSERDGDRAIGAISVNQVKMAVVVEIGRDHAVGFLSDSYSRPGDQFAIRGRANVETGPETTFALSVEDKIDDHLRAMVVEYMEEGWAGARV